jgi:hypothetical protein
MAAEAEALSARSDGDELGVCAGDLPSAGFLRGSSRSARLEETV